MASVVFHSFHQIHSTGKAKLFKSHHPEYKNGEQIRDFIYVKDVVNVLNWFMKYTPQNGIYNLGTGYARPFLALAHATFKALKSTPNIEFIDIPLDIRDKYQYYTQAEMQKARQVGLKKQFKPLELSIKDYVGQHLLKNRIW
jgi:ADP-L-glycero-D-manno-heptose 6-epimerase